MTPVQKNMIRDIIENEQWGAVIAAAQDIVTSKERDVITCSIDQGSRELTLRKARLEGAQAVHRYLTAFSKEAKDAQ